MARRFVRRKFIGNVLNLSHARGPVISWHESVNALMSQILPGRSILFISIDLDRLPASGYHAFIFGYMKNMPAIARYDSWNPADVITDGSIASCIMSAVQNILPGLALRWSSLAVSLRAMKRNALTSDGGVPVAMV